MRIKFITFFVLFILFFSSCDLKKDKKTTLKPPNNRLAISKTPYGNIGADSVFLFQLKNKNGTVVELTNYGGIITKIMVADKNGNFDDVVLGYDSLAHYVEKNPYFGAFLGRYANRIANGKFKIEEKEYQLATNNGPNALHGGIKGFDKKIWDAESFDSENKVGVVLSGISPDGEEGYPGNLSIKIKYNLNNRDELRMEYFAETDQTTVINFSNHSYFNLEGADSGSILNHSLELNANAFTPVDNTSIPTGEKRLVENTPFDFRKSTRIGARIDQIENAQIKIGNGYDHNFILNKNSYDLTLAATVHAPTSGRVLEVLTTQPGVQFYTGNYLGGKFIGKKGKAYASRDGFCLETQHFPNAPNQRDFPSTILNPGERFESTTVFRFLVR